MAFHFTLEAILRLRRSLEDSELLRLQALLTRRAALLHQLESLQQDNLNLQQRTGLAMLQRPTPAIEIHVAMDRVGVLRHQQQLVRTELGHLEGDIAEQRSRVEQQRRNREVLEALRDAQWRDYRLAQQRREQAQLDELPLLRRRTISP